MRGDVLTSNVDEMFAKSKTYASEAADVIPGSVNSNVRLLGFPFPICFDRGEGSYLYDIDGNRFIDFALGMGPSVLGHAPKQVCDAVAKSFATGQMLGGQHRTELELARRLQSLIPSGEKIRIGVTGSEVVQAALRVSRAFTGRSKFIKFEGQYHGWYDNVLISHAPPLGDELKGPSRQPHLETAGQSQLSSQEMIVLPWNDAAAVEQVLAEHGNEIAAIITEPAMCNTGVIAPVSGYLERLRELSTRYGVVLIFDEVVTGFRLSLGGAQQKFGVTPDLSTFAKAMAAGFPVSALAGRADIMDLFGSGKVNHSGTYNASIPSLYAAMATLDVLTDGEPGPLAEIDAKGTELMSAIRDIATTKNSTLRVSGFGAVFNTYFADPEFEVRDYTTYKQTDLTKQAAFLAGLVTRGIRPTNRGTWFVSATLSAEDISQTVAAIEAALEN